MSSKDKDSVKKPTPPDESDGSENGDDQVDIFDKDIMSSVLRLYQNSTELPSVLLKRALEEIIKLTGSKFGYIAEIKSRNSLVTRKNPNGKYLVIATIADGSGGKDVPRGYNQDKYREMTNIDSTWGRSVLDNKITYTRDVKSSEAWSHIPSGHPDFTAFAAVPLRFRNETIGQLGLADKPGGYKTVFLKKYEVYYNFLSSTLYNQITATKNLELLKEKEMNQAKNMFMANVSHEIRTPLNSILGMLVIMEDTALTSEQQDCTDVMKQSCYNLIALINDILDISKLEAGEMEVNVAPMNIDDVLKESHKIARIPSKDSRVEFYSKIDKDVPHTVVTDPQRIKQIIINLLNNAYKFTEKGSICIEVSVCSEDEAKKMQLAPLKEIKKSFKRWMRNEMQRTRSTAEIRKSKTISKSEESPDSGVRVRRKSSRKLSSDDSGSRVHSKYAKSSSIVGNKIGDWKYIKFAIHDTGIGIQEKDFDRLFRTFSQLDSTSTKQYSGTGLGLAIVDKFSKLMNGKVSFESKYEEGSTFYFVIPMCEYAEKEDLLDLSILKGKKVLVVDDNPNNIMRLCSYLDKWGMEYRECDSGQRAMLQYVGKERWKFDIGLIDIIMPGVDGNELAERIHESEYPFPVVAVSSEYSRNDGISSVFSFTLFKPYNEIQLAKTIISVLTNTEGATRSLTSGEASSSLSSENHIVPSAPGVPGSPKKNGGKTQDIPVLPTNTMRSKNKGSLRFQRTAEGSDGMGPDRERRVSNDGSRGDGGGGDQLRKSVPSPTKKNIFSRVFNSESPERKLRDELMTDIERNRARNQDQNGMLGVYNDAVDQMDVNILIAEDHLFNQKVIVSMLSSMGFYNIDMAENGREAVDLVKRNRGVEIKKNRKGKIVEKSAYDLILMDIAMPILDGVQASIQIDELFKHRQFRPKIVAVTANAMTGDKERYLGEGRMDDYISKPITSKEVLYNVIP